MLTVTHIYVSCLVATSSGLIYHYYGSKGGSQVKKDGGQKGNIQLYRYEDV